ncbi:MAG: signal peptidase II [Pseudomonadota bacterium]
MEKVLAEIKDWGRAVRANRLFWPVLLGALLVVALDQGSKNWIVYGLELPEQIRPCAKSPSDMCRQIALSPIFDLTYVQNRGASFGMLAGGAAGRTFLTIVSFGVVIGLIIWLGRLVRPVSAVAIAFIIGGALGNLYDRVTLGYVVDFLDFSGAYFPWVFNIADVAINIGVALLLFDAWREAREAKLAAVVPENMGPTTKAGPVASSASDQPHT